MDTGSDIDLLHSKEAKKYNFETYIRNDGKNEVLATINGRKRSFGHVYDIQVKIGEKFIPGGFISMDIGAIVNSIRNRTGLTISGIIGSATMKRLCFTIDYDKEEIVMKME